MQERPFDRRRQGNLGEISAIEWLSWKGATVFTPVGHSPDVDLVADFGEGPARIEVKTCLRPTRANWSVMIATMGGNRSWTGVVKRFDPMRCEYLFVHVGDGRRWFIPTDALECSRAVTLGGVKYSEFEIERGLPLLGARPLHSAASLGEYPRGQRMAAVNGPASPSQVRLLPPPSGSAGFREVRWERKMGRSGETRIGPKRQLTMPIRVAAEAGLSPGDRLRARAEGDGRISLERIAPPAQPELTTPAGSEPGEAA